MEQPKPLYEMQSVQPASTYDPTQGAIKAFRVDFITASGVRDYVTIPETEYNLEHIMEVVQAVAQKHENVVAAKGQPHIPGQATTHPWSQGS